MKINFVTTIIATAISLLISYGFYGFFEGDNKMIISVGTFVFLTITSVATIGVNFEKERSTTNIRVVSSIFFAIALISGLFYSFCNFSTAAFIIPNGLLLMIFILIVYSINKTKQ